MTNKSLDNLLKKMKDVSTDLENEIEPLSSDEAEEIGGGSGINVACPAVNSGCGANMGCSGGPH